MNYIALFYKPFISKALRYGPHVIMESHSFTCHPHMNHTCLLLPSRKASVPFGWYSFRLHTKEWPGWVGLGGWLRTEINVRHQELNLDMVTHPSTKRARRRLTSLMCTTPLPPVTVVVIFVRTTMSILLWQCPSWHSLVNFTQWDLCLSLLTYLLTIHFSYLWVSVLDLDWLVDVSSWPWPWS